MNRTVKRYFRLGSGWCFILAAILIGWLPFVQGWLLFLIGLTLLSTEWEPARKAHTWLERKFPRLFRYKDKLKEMSLIVFRRRKALPAIPPEEPSSTGIGPAVYLVPASPGMIAAGDPGSAKPIAALPAANLALTAGCTAHPSSPSVAPADSASTTSTEGPPA